ncbi:hypothetical protein OBBRIDRAFT_739382 [Obba rivulosa]|uniref:Uncharacterized protein n=1 Tax=Obba rivulosa TaxID=1052685 RepID=A0A8E2AJJ8_9APHY|nr:hypothetical protein OBBRIDRAFT_739382 [Obba rivulosa]
MILRRGPNRASFMWGSSTRNTRIERLWVEVGRRFCQWNAKPISGPDTHDRSPNVLRFIGQTKSGIYIDDAEDMHPDILHQFYGTTIAQPHRHAGQTGAGHPSDEEESDISDSEDLPTRIANQQQNQIRHDPVPVPDHESPFADEQDTELFFMVWAAIQNEPRLPNGYGVLPEEGQYEAEEIIRTGRRSRKELVVSLPAEVWEPRVWRWCKALALLNRMLFSETDSDVDD